MPALRRSKLGPLLVAAGFLMLLAQLELPGLGRLWPLLLLALGGGLLLLYLRGHGDGDEALLFNGLLGVLLGVFFQLVELRWIHLAGHWPFLLLAPGLALGVVSVMSAGQRGLVLPAAGLVGLALILYLFTSGLIVTLVKVTLRIVVPVVLVLIGAWLTFGGLAGRRRRSAPPADASEPLPEKVEPAPRAPSPSVDSTTAAVDVDTTNPPPVH